MARKKKIWIVFCSLLGLTLGSAAYSGTESFNRSMFPALEFNALQVPSSSAGNTSDQALLQQPVSEKAPALQTDIEAPAEKGPAPSISPGPVAVENPPQKTAQQAEPALPESSWSIFTDSSHCGYSGTSIILFLGTDERDEMPYGADVIRFLKVDFTNLTVVCVALSRDLWVKTPALADKHIKEKRLGEVFDVVQMSTKGTLKEQYLAATTILTQTIFDNFGVAPDRYLTVPQSSFANLVDGLGGIEVEVPQDQDAYKHVLLTGKQNLNGQQALAYIRLVEQFGVGDLGRNSRQLPFIKAVFARMIEPANMVKLPGIVYQLQDSIVTDLSPVRIASLTCMLSQVPRANITFHTLTPDMTTPGPENSLLPDVPKIQAWLQGLLKK